LKRLVSFIVLNERIIWGCIKVPRKSPRAQKKRAPKIKRRGKKGDVWKILSTAERKPEAKQKITRGISVKNRIFPMAGTAQYKRRLWAKKKSVYYVI